MYILIQFSDAYVLLINIWIEFSSEVLLVMETDR